MSKITFLKGKELLREEIESCFKQAKMAEEPDLQELMCMEQAELISAKLGCLEYNTELEKLKCLIESENGSPVIMQEEVLII